MNYSTCWHTRRMQVTVEDCSAVQWKERRAVRHAWDNAASQQRGTNKWHSPTWILLRQEVTRDWPMVFAASTAMECPWGRHRKAVERGSYITWLSILPKSTPLRMCYLYHKANKITHYSMQREGQTTPRARENLGTLWINSKNWPDLKLVSHEQFHSQFTHQLCTSAAFWARSGRSPLGRCCTSQPGFQLSLP